MVIKILASQLMWDLNAIPEVAHATLGTYRVLTKYPEDTKYQKILNIVSSEGHCLSLLLHPFLVEEFIRSPLPLKLRKHVQTPSLWNIPPPWSACSCQCLHSVLKSLQTDSSLGHSATGSPIALCGWGSAVRGHVQASHLSSCLIQAPEKPHLSQTSVPPGLCSIWQG